MRRALPSSLHRASPAVGCVLLLLAACGGTPESDADSADGSALRRKRPKSDSSQPNANATPSASASSEANAPSTNVPAPLDPFTIDSSRATLTGLELKTYLDDKDTSANGVRIGTFEIHSRARDCGSPCGAWTPTTDDVLVPMSDRNYPRPTPQNGDIYVFRGQLVFFAKVPGATAPTAGTGYFGTYCEASYPQDGLALERDCRASPTFRFTGSRPFTPKNIWDLPYSATSFYFPGEMYLGMQSLASGTSTIQFAGRAYRDGTVHLVTRTGAANTGNGMHQLAIVGQLDGLP